MNLFCIGVPASAPSKKANSLFHLSFLLYYFMRPTCQNDVLPSLHLTAPVRSVVYPSRVLLPDTVPVLVLSRLQEPVTWASPHLDEPPSPDDPLELTDVEWEQELPEDAFDHLVQYDDEELEESDEDLPEAVRDHLTTSSFERLA